MRIRMGVITRLIALAALVGILSLHHRAYGADSRTLAEQTWKALQREFRHPGGTESRTALAGVWDRPEFGYDRDGAHRAWNQALEHLRTLVSNRSGAGDPGRSLTWDRAKTLLSHMLREQAKSASDNSRNQKERFNEFAASLNSEPGTSYAHWRLAELHENQGFPALAAHHLLRSHATETDPKYVEFNREWFSRLYQKITGEKFPGGDPVSSVRLLLGNYLQQERQARNRLNEVKRTFFSPQCRYGNRPLADQRYHIASREEQRPFYYRITDWEYVETGEDGVHLRPKVLPYGAARSPASVPEDVKGTVVRIPRSGLGTAEKVCGAVQQALLPYLSRPVHAGAIGRPADSH